MRISAKFLKFMNFVIILCMMLCCFIQQPIDVCAEELTVLATQAGGGGMDIPKGATQVVFSSSGSYGQTMCPYHSSSYCGHYVRTSVPASTIVFYIKNGDSKQEVHRVQKNGTTTIDLSTIDSKTNYLEVTLNRCSVGSSYCSDHECTIPGATSPYSTASTTIKGVRSPNFNGSLPHKFH